MVNRISGRIKPAPPSPPGREKTLLGKMAQEIYKCHGKAYKQEINRHIYTYTEKKLPDNLAELASFERVFEAASKVIGRPVASFTDLYEGDWKSSPLRVLNARDLLVFCLVDSPEKALGSIYNATNYYKGWDLDYAKGQSVALFFSPASHHSDHYQYEDIWAEFPLSGRFQNIIQLTELVQAWQQRHFALKKDLLRVITDRVRELPDKGHEFFGINEHILLDTAGRIIEEAPLKEGEELLFWLPQNKQLRTLSYETVRTAFLELLKPLSQKVRKAGKGTNYPILEELMANFALRGKKIEVYEDKDHLPTPTFHQVILPEDLFVIKKALDKINDWKRCPNNLLLEGVIPNAIDGNKNMSCYIIKEDAFFSPALLKSLMSKATRDQGLQIIQNGLNPPTEKPLARESHPPAPDRGECRIAFRSPIESQPPVHSLFCFNIEWEERDLFLRIKQMGREGRELLLDKAMQELGSAKSVFHQNAARRTMEILEAMPPRSAAELLYRNKERLPAFFECAPALKTLRFLTVLVEHFTDEKLAELLKDEVLPVDIMKVILSARPRLRTLLPADSPYDIPADFPALDMATLKADFGLVGEEKVKRAHRKLTLAEKAETEDLYHKKLPKNDMLESAYADWMIIVNDFLDKIKNIELLAILIAANEWYFYLSKDKAKAAMPYFYEISPELYFSLSALQLRSKSLPGLSPSLNHGREELAIFARIKKLQGVPEIIITINIKQYLSAMGRLEEFEDFELDGIRRRYLQGQRLAERARLPELEAQIEVPEVLARADFIQEHDKLADSAKLETALGILGCRPEDNPDLVKKLFRKLSRIFHPDRAGNEQSSVLAFKLVKLAYKTWTKLT